MRVLFRPAALAVALLVWAPAPRPPDPAPGVLLVARESIEGGPFWHSVVLLVAHGADGTLGIIVNRGSEVTLSEVLPDLGDEDGPRIYFGGPVALDGLVFLFRAEEAPEEATHVLDDVYFEGRLETLKGLLEKGSAVKLFLGHAGWGPGQLAAELRRGSWDLVQADAFTLFGKDPETLWPELSGESRTLAGVRIPDSLGMRAPETF